MSSTPTRSLLALIALLGSATSQAADLAALVSLAEKSDPQYQERQHQALAVAEGIPQAKAALWLPRLAFTIGGNRTEQDITAAIAPGGNSTGYYGSDYRLSLQQPVFHRDRYLQLGQADKRLKQAQLEVDVAWQALLLRVAERYFGVLAAQDTLVFAKAERESLAGQLEQTRQRFDVGLVAITDVQEAQAGFDRAVAQVITAENALENAREALREVAGEAPAELARLGEEFPLERPTPDDPERWTEQAVQQNLSVAAAQIATEVAAEDINIASAGHFPTIDIEGGQGYSSRGGQFGETEISGSDIGIRLNVPLYEGGAVVSRTRQATQTHAAAVDRLEQARRATYRSAREAFLGVVTQISSVKALRQAVVSSATALESTKAGFEVGTRTSIDVVTAERGLSQARRDLSRARYDYVLNLLRLKQAAGTLGPDDITRTNTWLTGNVAAAMPSANAPKP